MTTAIARTGPSAPPRRMDELAMRPHQGAARTAGPAAAARSRSEDAQQAREADAARDRILGDLQLAGQTHASPAQRRVDVVG